jgi:excisionase family DNA binding protein
MARSSCKVSQSLLSKAPQLERRCLNITEAAAYIGATVWFMRTLVWERKIPFAKRGARKLVFDKTDLDLFVDTQKITSA